MSDSDLGEGFIWATRGRSWGFRFLLTGGSVDPLPDYESVFAHIDDEPIVWHRVGTLGGLRFPDPLGRRDSAGRVIPHEFVVGGELAGHIASAQDGQRLIWPLVEAAYERVWDAERAPLAAELEFHRAEPPNSGSS